ncbi:ABC transporter permease [Herbiconiux sp. L3-i23]|uniref:ABC transporter permease n=1 Tax=Herbiconiux sp. L3-i23 TaxID=2905871 RepID=UPI002047FCCD|nr:ABC transporter permease subunit [Herbiconiux sp. L3-i23]BDI23578.1 ABC transporter permease [Herbiconiux sp. L3-i23]
MNPSRVTRIAILGLVGLVFAIPIVGMIAFTLRGGLEGGLTLDRWLALFDPEEARAYTPVFRGLGNSLVLALVTVLVMLLLLVPTMVLVRLRFPKVRPIMEFLCLLPISVPAIVLVVGLAPIYQVLSRTFGSGIWTLALAYVVLVLPFSYRAIQANLDAVDVTTLAEASRSLGAGWVTTLLRVILPNLRRGVLAAALISVAVVLGEFTFASLLSRVNLQTSLLVVSKQDPFGAVIFTLLALLFAFLLLIVIGRVGAGRTSRRTS